jgi:hypothetical protein
MEGEFPVMTSRTVETLPFLHSKFLAKNKKEKKA